MGNRRSPLRGNAEHHLNSHTDGGDRTLTLVVSRRDRAIHARQRNDKSV